MLDLYYLKIKAQKVQDFIFKVPKLKAMLGANSLLGEFFAEDLPGLRANKKKYSSPKCWIDFTSELKALPKWGENDDLKANFDKGVICSAGGHFETVFPSKIGADKEEQYALDFINDVRKEAREKIPGVRISFFLKEYKDFDSKKDSKKDSEKMKYKDFDDNGTVIPIDADTTEIIIDNPYFYPSSEDGENPQLIRGYQPSKKVKPDKDSITTKNIKEAGDKFYNGERKDYLCKFLKNLTKENDKELSKDKFSELFENDLTKFAKLSLIPKNNKIAIIAIDGNAMGARFTKFRDTLSDKPVFDALIEMEKFWFTQRDTFRNALHNSLNSIDISPYKQYDKKEKKELRKLPYHVMMLGGDDLLIVSVPEIAFDLVHNFGKQIQSINSDLSISAGIAFVKSSYPFAHAHELAESLLSSAKVKSRIWEKAINENGEKPPITTYRNTIDWHVHFPSGTEEIDKIRQQNYMLQYNDKTEILTQRPCTMKEAMKVWENSKALYEKILKAGKEENENFENSTGRNKYKGLRTLLKTGEENVKLYTKIQDIEKEYSNFLPLESHIENLNEKVKINTALDIIELMDFHKREEKKRSENESN